MESEMSNDSELQAARERLSALADGELELTAVSRTCAEWRDSADHRAAWHTYQLIGDVLRSDDLASDPARDASFMSALRARLAQEPVVLAPQPLYAPAVSPVPARAVANGSGGRRWGWMAPTAVAAGFVAVAGVMTLSRAPGLLPDVPALASVAPTLSAPATPVATLVGASGVAVEPQALVSSGQMIRDARLDRYLAAHKQFAGSSALGVPSGFLRNATAEVPGR
jgi:sigma-E factor negative regulatory protein RseA